MHRRLLEIARYVDDQREALLAAAHPVPADRWTVRPAAEQWSVSEVLEHLHRVERGTARLLGGRVAEARAAGCPIETDETSVMACLDFAGLTDRGTPRVAPERVAPEGGWARDRVLEALAASRADLQAVMTASDGLALQSIRQEHARLGEIDLYQWLLFIGKHEARHVPQVREIASALGAAAH